MSFRVVDGSRPPGAGVSPPGTAPARRRRPTRRTGVAALAAAALVAVLATWLALPSAADTTRFMVWDRATAQAVYERPMEVGETFTLGHTHSVTKRPVIETFSVQDSSTIALQELWFDEPGPGLPAGPEDLGDGTTTFLQEDGAFRVLHHGHPIGSVPLLVGSAEVDHMLTFQDGTRVRLLDVAGAGSRVELSVGDRP